jgi:hypothetical protein
LGSFLTIFKAFKQWTITLLIIHSALYEELKEKLPDPLGNHKDSLGIEFIQQ